MADLILMNYQLLPVINRFEIQLGFGEKTIEQICKSKNIDTDFFVEIVNAFHDENYLPEKHFQNRSLSLIINYLKKSHNYFINVKLQNIELMINEFVKKCCSEEVSKIELIKSFFEEYKKELIIHIDHEDSVVYPYAILLEKVFLYQKKEDLEEFKKYKYNINKYASEHSDVEEKIFDLKNIIIKYIPKTKETNLCNHILFDLFELEKDLINHQRIEEKVLIPNAIKMENKVINN